MKLVKSVRIGTGPGFHALVYHSGREHYEGHMSDL